MQKAHKATLHLNRYLMDFLALSFPNVNLHDFTVLKKILCLYLTCFISLSLGINVSMSESFFVLFKNFWVFVISLFKNAPIENPGRQMTQMQADLQGILWVIRNIVELGLDWEGKPLGERVFSHGLNDIYFWWCLSW